MKIALAAGATLLLAMSAMIATNGTASASTTASILNGATTIAAATTTTVIAPGERKTSGHITVTNGNYEGHCPAYAGSNGKVRIKCTPTGTEIKCDGSVRGRIEGVAGGDNVIVSTNSNPVDVSGTGGTVAVGSGSTVNITNTSGVGGTTITATTPGGSVITVLPGMTVPITG